ncbi:hypothetical protein ABES03_22410 [Neobacillus rhizosphaerae]|uniref:hypothetical protein n=1 Tax=Neobacillus rhizosphaerae TaxID=2880965 RepID=UPI003D295695
MLSFRGDAHKIYLQLNKAIHNGESIKDMKGFKEIEAIQKLYYSLDSEQLQLIYYRMIKEKSGSGIIPIFVSSVPWLLFLFSKPLMDFLFKDGSMLWALFGFGYLLILIGSVILHFREKAWATFHMEIIRDILKERNQGE